MLIGHVPFSGDSATIVMMKHLQEPVPSVLEERPDVPPPIGRVVARAMAKVPGNRYQNVSELIEDLTIASGMIVPVPIAQPSNSATTSESPAVSTTSDDRDEVTVVRPRQEYPSAEQPSAQQYPAASSRRAPVTVPVAPARHRLMEFQSLEDTDSVRRGIAGCLCGHLCHHEELDSAARARTPIRTRPSPPIRIANRCSPRNRPPANPRRDFHQAARSATAWSRLAKREC